MTKDEAREKARTLCKNVITPTLVESDVCEWTALAGPSDALAEQIATALLAADEAATKRCAAEFEAEREKWNNGNMALLGEIAALHDKLDAASGG